ncbi:hypothetical protein MMC21_005310 [Puttea exsequens]|nr:hypothetical protein [Puttea exsequens]
MEDGKYVDGSIWFYAPNKGAPVVFAVFFAASCAVHLWQCIHYQAFKFTGLLPFSALVFTAGYIMREVGAYNRGNIDVFISSVCLVYAAPPLYELANYVTLGRILYYIPYHSPIHPGRVLTTFGAISAIVEALNGNGASYSSNAKLSDSKQAMGRALIKAALIIQLAVITSFLTLAVYFHRRCRAAGLYPKNLRAVLITLYTSSALIMIRTIYRTVEYFEVLTIHPRPGFDPNTISPIVRYEWFFWVFEATLMVCNSVLLNVRHPAMYLPRSNKVFLAEDGVTEVEGPGYEDKRNFLVTLADPFDIGGLIRGRDKVRYWETGTSAGGGDGVENGMGNGVGNVVGSGAGDVKV